MSDGRFNQTSPFKRLTSFGALDGWKKQRVLVGDEPHLLECQSLELTRVKHNWPSQWHSRHPEGYIEFENGKRFDLATGTNEKKPAFIFWLNEITEIFYRRHTLEKRIYDFADKTSPGNLDALKELLMETSGDNSLPAEFVPLSSVQKHLILLSVLHLEEIVGLISIPEPNNERWFRGKAA